jgi:hypothetical protein
LINFTFDSTAIAEGGPEEHAIIISEIHVIKFVDLNGHEKSALPYNSGNVTSMAIKDQLIAISFQNRIDIVSKLEDGTTYMFPLVSSVIPLMSTRSLFV